MKGISAYNVNSGGGKVLLFALLEEVKNDKDVIIWLDKRTQPYAPVLAGKIHFVNPSLSGRLQAEMEIKKLSSQIQSILFFGNLPPLFRPASDTKCYLFLQNRYIIQPDSFNHASWKSFFRSFMERLWFKFFLKEDIICVVQNDSMKRLFHQEMGKEKICKVIPFASEFVSRNDTLGSKRKFIYVSSPDTHKNHSTLIEAFKILANEKIFPSLTLIFNTENYPELFATINLLKEELSLQIEVKNEVSHDLIPEVLKEHECLIYPSKMESFGLPLIEARNLGLSIIASELDYVRDLLDPNESFDPGSAKSIARAIKRYLSLPEKREVIRTPGEFLKELEF